MFYVIIFIIITNIIYLYNFSHYFKYNDKILYFDTDCSNNKIICNTIEKYGIKKDPSKNLNQSSCKVLNFFDISNNCNEYIKKFHTDEFLNKMKILVNEPELHFIDENKDPLSFAIQLYKNGDFMKYHFDTNFTLGTRYTVLILLYVNENNESYLHIKNKNKIEKKILLDPGDGIIYNGDKVYHKVSNQCINGERVTLIINLTTNKQYNIFGKILQKIRNYMFKKYTL